MSDSTGNAQPFKGPEVEASVAVAEIITNAPSHAINKRTQKNRRPTKREVYNDEFDAIGTYHAGGPRGGDFDILKLVAEHEHEGDTRLEILTRSREVVDGKPKIVIGRVFAPREEVEIFPVETEPESQDDIHDRAVKVAEQLGHEPTAYVYNRFKHDADQHARIVGEKWGHTAWDLPMYDGLSTAEAYWDSRGMPALRPIKSWMPKLSETSPLTEHAVEQAEDTSSNGGSSDEPANNKPHSTKEKIKQDLEAVRNTKLGKFIVERAPKRKPQPYWKIHGLRDLEELMSSPRVEKPFEKQLAFDIDSPKPDSKDDAKISELPSETMPKPELRLPPVNLEQSWKDMDPTKAEAQKQVATDTGTAIEAEPQIQADPHNNLRGFLNGKRKAKEESSRRKAIRATVALGLTALALCGAYKAGDNQSETLKQYINNQWAEIQDQQKTIDRLSQTTTEVQPMAPSTEQAPAKPRTTESTAPQPKQPNEEQGPVTTETTPVTTELKPAEKAPAETTTTNAASTDTTKIHDSPGIPQELAVFEVVKGTSVAKEIGEYAHNLQGLELSDAQKQQVYEQLYSEFGDKIVNVRYDQKNVVMVNGNLLFSSTNDARWYSPKVQARVDELIKQAKAS